MLNEFTFPCVLLHWSRGKNRPGYDGRFANRQVKRWIKLLCWADLGRPIPTHGYLESALVNHGHVIRAYGGERARPKCQGRKRVHEYRTHSKSPEEHPLLSLSSHSALNATLCHHTILSTPGVRTSIFGYCIAPLISTLHPYHPHQSHFLDPEKDWSLGLF